MSSFYLTTTLPYVNAKPHIGHALEFVQADVICRRRRQHGDAVLFNVGTDEHGLKIFQKATELAIPVQQFVDDNAQTFVDFFEQFAISYTNFYRTSSPEHRAVAQGMRERCMANGDIYKKRYTGLYCVGCESFKTSKDLIPLGSPLDKGELEGIEREGVLVCPDHLTAPVPFEQENYFFKLASYKEQLKQYYINHKALLPENKLSELLNFIENLEDISISRTKESLPRGVPVPGDDDQVMYVWFDALSNYIGAVGFPHDIEQAKQLQAGCVQIFGPDNLRFQCIIWQAMLASAGLPFTKTFLMHGMILGPDGNKMSKTLGNVISPMDQLDKYGAEAVRFYLIAGIPTFGDASYKEEDLVNLYNARLANSFGNLLSRVITLANKKNIRFADKHDLSPLAERQIATSKQSVAEAFDNYALYEAAGQIHELTMRANKYIDDCKPREQATDPVLASQCLIDLGAVLAILIELYSPIIPEHCARAQQMLISQEKGVLFQRLEH